MTVERPPNGFEIRESLTARATIDDFGSRFIWFGLFYYCVKERLKISAHLEGRALRDNPAQRAMHVQAPDEEHTVSIAYGIEFGVVTIQALKISIF